MAIIWAYMEKKEQQMIRRQAKGKGHCGGFIKFYVA